MKYLFILLAGVISVQSTSYAQQYLTGTVTDTAGQPLAGTSVRYLSAKTQTLSDKVGGFSIPRLSRPDTLVVTYMGYLPEFIPVVASTVSPVYVVLVTDPNAIEEVVVNTGYYKIPRERSTGSFTHIDNELINRSVSTDIVSRLEGVSNSLDFDRRLASPLYGEGSLSLRIRGLSTLNADNAPLVVLDNFPYEGDLLNINPNDVESVTILKDAAAASIWGAKAANGVIVINTKTGRFGDQPSISVSSNLTVGQIPDLYYNPGFMASADFIAVEKELFSRGYYDSQEANPLHPPLSPVVELLAKHRDGLIETGEMERQLEILGRVDMRNEVSSLFYRRPVTQQYSINASGGSRIARYYVSGGFDRNLSEKVGNGYSRNTVTATNTLKLLRNLTLTSNMAIMQYRTTDHGLGIEDISPDSRSLYPYAVLTDENGHAAPIPRDHSIGYSLGAEESGLLDWMYRPWDELRLKENKSWRIERRVSTAASYNWNESVSVEAHYQFQAFDERRRTVTDEQSYEIRHQVNRFTQEDGTKIFPEGGRLDERAVGRTVHSGRLQLNYSNKWIDVHQFDVLAGAERRQVTSSGNNFRLYGYNDDILTHDRRLDFLTRFPVRPQGLAQLPLANDITSGEIDRYISYYMNAAYAFDNRFSLSVSARNDASNLFGVRSNQQWVPLWSIGASWDLWNENFYRLAEIPYLKLRLTYGFNGNIDKSATAFTTARYATNSLTGLRQATIVSPGNADLRWEKVRIWNAGLDLRSRNQRVFATLEYFHKKGQDLIGRTPLDRTSGFLASYMVNHANIVTQGLDIEVNTKNLTGRLRWETSVLTNIVRDRVLNYLGPTSAGLTNDLSVPPIEGRPRYSVFSYPWYGLDSETGDPLVMVEGELNKNYSAYVRGLSLDDLVFHGSSIPTMVGSIRNTLMWKGLSCSFNVVWKQGYYFRRSTINYDSLFDSWVMHRDYYSRWQEKGDESTTHVPSLPDQKISLRSQVYTLSTQTISRGDHIRLKDVNLSYNFTNLSRKGNGKIDLTLLLYMRNIGILWRSDPHRLDPDLPRSNFPAHREVSFGLNLKF